MSTSLEKVARRLLGLEREVRNLKKPQLAYSSVEDGAVDVNVDGQQVMSIGLQYDGTSVAASLVGPTPPEPSPATLTPVAGGLRVHWDGTFVNSLVAPLDFSRVAIHAVADPGDLDPLNPAQRFAEISTASGGDAFVSLPPDPIYVYLVVWTQSGKFSVSEPVTGTPMVSLGQAIEDEPPPTDPEIIALYPEGYGYWQMDADGNAVGFWRLTEGEWVPQSIVTIAALKANNAIITALFGEVITGLTIQTRKEERQGIKLIYSVDDDGNVSDGLFVYNEDGEVFLSAVPGDGMAVIAGKLTADILTVTDGASLAAITEITRAPDGSPGVVRWNAFTTEPKAAPVVLPGYQTTQFDNDFQWDSHRTGLATDGVNWYTLRLDFADLWVEKWASNGDFVSRSLVMSGLSVLSGVVGGVAVDPSFTYLYWTFQYRGGGWDVGRRLLSDLSAAGTNAFYAEGLDNAKLALGSDPATGELLLAQVRNDDHVRVRRATYSSAGTLTLGTFVDSDFEYGKRDLGGIWYGAADFGANRYVFSSTGDGWGWRVMSTGGVRQKQSEWPAGVDGKNGLVYKDGNFYTMTSAGYRIKYSNITSNVEDDPDMTLWVSNALADATLTTMQGPKKKYVLPKRARPQVTTSAINGGGTNAPDRVRIYIGRGTTEPARTAMWRQVDPSIGDTNVIYDTILGSGLNPESANGFIAAGGTVQRAELADETLVFDGLGRSEFLQGGTVASGTLVADTNKDVTVTFTTPFKVVPKVVIGLAGNLGNPSTAHVVKVSATTTNFVARFRRDGGTGEMDADWIAMPAN